MPRVAFMFDFDGTLFDTMGKHADLAADVISTHFKVPKSTARKAYLATAGIPFPRQLEKIFEQSSPELRARCEAEYVKRKGVEVYGNAKPFRDVKPAMELLKAKGFDLYVASSTETKILNETLQRHGLRDYFSGVFGIDQGNKIEHVKAVRVARRPDIIPFVGDSPSDVGLRKKGAGNEVFTVGRAGRPKQGMQRRGMLKKAGATLVTNDLRHLVDIDFSKALTRAAQGKRYHRTPLRFARMLTRHLRRK